MPTGSITALIARELTEAPEKAAKAPKPNASEQVVLDILDRAMKEGAGTHPLDPTTRTGPSSPNTSGDSATTPKPAKAINKGPSAWALALGTRSYSSVATILKNAQDKKAADPEQPSLFHENIRGSGYYH